MDCNCDLCEARRRNCHPYEVYFGNKFEAELVRANPDLPIYVYESCAKNVKTEADKKRAIQSVKDWNKKIEYKEVPGKKHPLRIFLPVVKLLRWLFGKTSSYLQQIEEAITTKNKWERVE